MSAGHAEPGRGGEGRAAPGEPTREPSPSTTRLCRGETVVEKPRSAPCARRHINYDVFMVPALVKKAGHAALVLPPGLHFVGFREFRDTFVFTAARAWQFEGFQAACRDLRTAGCAKIYVGGSFVTSKLDPSDFDACWDPVGVNPSLLDPVFYDDNLHLERREKYRGDLLIGGCDPGPSGENFRFLSRDKQSGEERGMIGIKLKLLEILNS